MATRTPDSANLYIFSDREFLALVNDQAKSAGWATSEDVAKVIFPARFNGNGTDEAARRAKRCVSIRLAWMRRYGVIEKREYKKGEKRETPETEWALTAEGVLFMRGALSSKQESALSGSGEDQLLALMSFMTNSYRNVSRVGATMIRREWLHGTVGQR